MYICAVRLLVVRFVVNCLLFGVCSRLCLLLFAFCSLLSFTTVRRVFVICRCRRCWLCWWCIRSLVCGSRVRGSTSFNTNVRCLLFVTCGSLCYSSSGCFLCGVCWFVLSVGGYSLFVMCRLRCRLVHYVVDISFVFHVIAFVSVVLYVVCCFNGDRFCVVYCSVIVVASCW